MNYIISLMCVVIAAIIAASGRDSVALFWNSGLLEIWPQARSADSDIGVFNNADQSKSQELLKNLNITNTYSFKKSEFEYLECTYKKSEKIIPDRKVVFRYRTWCRLERLNWLVLFFHRSKADDPKHPIRPISNQNVSTCNDA